jgi:hypothetical protein
MNRTTKITIGLAVAVLMAGAMMAFFASRPFRPRTFVGHVKDLLPAASDLRGWTVEYLPIADTPEMKAKVAEALNYDDAIFAVYTKGTQHVSVYLAYWSPGKMPFRFIASHTPDVCWVNAGWQEEAAQSGILLPVGRSGQLPPAEERTMLLNGNTEHVVFWHLLDGVPMNYGTRGIPPWYATFADLFTRNLNQRPEQFFIRVSSSEPVAAWPAMDLFQVLATRLQAHSFRR